MSSINNSRHYSATTATTSSAPLLDSAPAATMDLGQSAPSQPHSPLPIHAKPPLLARGAFIDWNSQTATAGNRRPMHHGAQHDDYGPAAADQLHDAESRAPSFESTNMVHGQEHRYAIQQTQTQPQPPNPSHAYSYDPYFVTPPASTSPLNNSLAHDYYPHPSAHPSSSSSSSHPQGPSDYHSVSLPPFQMAYTMRAGGPADKDPHHFDALPETANMAPRLSSMHGPPPTYMAPAYPPTYLPSTSYPSAHFSPLSGYASVPQSMGYSSAPTYQPPIGHHTGLSAASPVHSVHSVDSGGGGGGGGGGSGSGYDRSHSSSPSVANGNRKARSIRPRYQCPTCGLFTPLAPYPASGLGSHPYYGNAATSYSASGSASGRGGSSSHSGSQCCQNCSTRRTPLWRKNERGQTLCNACGLYERIHKRSRPIPPSLALAAEMEASSHAPHPFAMDGYPMAMYASNNGGGGGNPCSESCEPGMPAQWSTLNHLALMKEYCIRWWRFENEWKDMISSKVNGPSAANSGSSDPSHAASSPPLSYAISSSDLASWSQVLEAQLKAIQEAISKRHDEEQHAVFDSFIE